MGAVNQSIWPPLLTNWKKLPDFEIATYRIRQFGPVRFGKVSPNFFEVLGVAQPAVPPSDRCR